MIFCRSKKVNTLIAAIVDGYDGRPGTLVYLAADPTVARKGYVGC